MRKEATLKNSTAGLLNRFATLLFVFLVRHFFAKYLDAEYLGFEGFFQNVLGLFSLVDLGLGTAISFDLYEPIYKNERGQISSIMMLYKKMYCCIGVVIFIMSLMFTPFLLSFINGYTVGDNSIRLYFLIYAFGVAVSYFFSYKRTLLFAYQKNHIVTNVDTIVKVLGSIMQIFVLVYLQNYLFYLLIIVLINIGSNLLISIITDKGDYYDTKNTKPLSQNYKKKLTQHVKALAVTNIAWQGVASTDNIIISATVGIIDLAKNANYATITQAINGIATSVLGGVSASIGDLLAEGNKTKIKEYFDKYCFIYNIVAAYACLGMIFVSPSVIKLWVGEKYVFDWIPVLLISFNMYLNLIFKPAVDYQNYSGSFVYYKPYSIVALFINLTVSIIGALTIGISGVFFGTTVTYIFMNYAVIKIVYKHVLNESPLNYYKAFLKTNIPFLLGFITVLILENILSFTNSIVELIVKVLMVSIIYFGYVIAILHNDSNFIFFGDLVKKIVKKLYYNKDIR